MIFTITSSLYHLKVFFLPVKLKHSYNTHLALKNSYSLPLIRTNYGKFSIRFQGPK